MNKEQLKEYEEVYKKIKEEKEFFIYIKEEVKKELKKDEIEAEKKEGKGLYNKLFGGR